MLALPAEAGALGERLFHHRRGIDEDLERRRSRLADEPGGQHFQPALDEVVIIAIAGIDRDRRRRFFRKDGERVALGAVIHADAE